MNRTMLLKSNEILFIIVNNNTKNIFKNIFNEE